MCKRVLKLVCRAQHNINGYFKPSCLFSFLQETPSAWRRCGCRESARTRRTRWWAASWTSTTWRASSTCCWWRWASACWCSPGNTCFTGNYDTPSTSRANLTSCWPSAGWELLITWLIGCCVGKPGRSRLVWLLEVRSRNRLTDFFTLIISLSDWLAACDWISSVTAWLSDWNIGWVIILILSGCLVVFFFSGFFFFFFFTWNLFYVKINGCKLMWICM